MCVAISWEMGLCVDDCNISWRGGIASKYESRCLLVGTRGKVCVKIASHFFHVSFSMWFDGHFFGR